MAEYADVKKRFEADTAKHEMTVLHDDGLYRHLQFKAPDRSSYWFNLITWPSVLTISGDMGCFVFARVEDMFEFFRGNRINPQYWAEKVRADSGVTDYDEDLLRKQVTEDLKTAEEGYPGVTAAWTEKVNGVFAEYYTTTENDARAALNDFEFLPEGDKGEPFRFQEVWEWDLRTYTHQFLWCCHAIQWGIAQYDGKRVEAVAGRG